MEPIFTISPIDIAIIVIYFVIIIGIVLGISSKTKTGEDFFLAGRSLTWGMIGLSLFASNVSSSTIIGLSGQAYNKGISVSNYEWMATLILVFIAIYIIPFFINNRISTTPEFLQQRYNTPCRQYFSALLILTNIIVDIAGGLFAGALVLQSFFPYLEIWQLSTIIALFCGAYTAIGGLRAVVYTDAIQTAILFAGSCFLSFFLFKQVDFSWATIVENTPHQMLSLIQPLNDDTLPWLGTLIGLPILGFYYWGTNQFIIQRVLAAKDLDNARWGLLLAGFLKLPVLFIMVMPGLIARLHFENLPNPDLIFPMMVIEFLPVGVTGLVLAGLIAAIMSSIDSTLNSASTLLTLDFIKPKYPNLSESTLASVGKKATIGFMIFSIAWTPVIGTFQGLFEYLQATLSYLVPPVVAIYLIGMFWKNAHGKAALITLISGHLISIGALLLNKTGIITVHFTILAGILFFICCGIFITLSLILEDKMLSKQQQALLTAPSDALSYRQIPFYKDYKVISFLLIVLTMLILVTFW